MDISLIGVPTTYGCGKDGAQYGPSKLREFGIFNALSKNHRVFDMGDIFIPETSNSKNYQHIYVEPLMSICTNLAHNVYSAMKVNTFPLIFGGDHSIAIGSLAGVSRHNANLAVIWIDAHADINTFDTSPTGNIHGMPLAASMNVGDKSLTDIYFKGQKVAPKNVYIIGARDVDKGEFELIDQVKLNFYPMDKVREMGLENVIGEVIEKIKASEVDGVHLSFDIDALDSSLVPGTGTPVKDGFSLEEGQNLLTSFLSQGFIKSMDFVELNPSLDIDDMTINNSMELIKTVSSSLK